MVKTKHPSWLILALAAAGIFIGSYWMITAFFSGMTQARQPWWRSLVPLAPGAAIWLMTMLARRAPLPYGTGLAVLGFMALLFSWPHGRLLQGVILGGPVLLVGLGFILLRKKIEAEVLI